jgi:hypothetical protein
MSEKWAQPVEGFRPEAVVTMFNVRGKVWHPSCYALAEHNGHHLAIEKALAFWPTSHKCEWCGGGAFGPTGTAVEAANILEEPIISSGSSAGGDAAQARSRGRG